MGRAEPTFVAPSSVEGYGLFAKEKILRGKFVIEYVGEIISNEEAERRGAFYDLRGCSYLFDLYIRGVIPFYVIDSRFIGNRSRFINHSKKNPNLNVSILLVNGVRRIGFYASKDIDKDEELFFDYGYSEEHKKKHGIID